MALNFPSSPTTGNQFKSPQGLTWQWDGAKWTAIGIVSNRVTQSQVFITAEVLPGTISTASAEATDVIQLQMPPPVPMLVPTSVNQGVPTPSSAWVGQ